MAETETKQYPFGTYLLNVSELHRRIFVHVVASKEHYALFIPLVDDGEVTPLYDNKKTIQAILKLVPFCFNAIVDEYVKCLPSYGFSVSLPPRPTGTFPLKAITVRLQCAPKEFHGRSEEPEPLRLDGEYLFIASGEANVVEYIPSISMDKANAQ